MHMVLKITPALVASPESRVRLFVDESDVGDKRSVVTRDVTREQTNPNLIEPHKFYVISLGKLLQGSI
jgi:hypothetical protein